MKTAAQLRRIAGEVCGLFPGEAGEFVAFAGLLEDLDAAKKRKLEMIANMPPSRAQMLQNTIAFEQGRANAAEVPMIKWVTFAQWARCMSSLIGDDAEIIAEARSPNGQQNAKKVGAYMTWALGQAVDDAIKAAIGPPPHEGKLHGPNKGIIYMSTATKNAAQIAAEVVTEHGLRAIAWGDSWLLHEVATRLGMQHEGPRTEKKVLDRIDRSNGDTFTKFIYGYPERGLARTRRFVLK